MKHTQEKRSGVDGDWLMGALVIGILLVAIVGPLTVMMWRVALGPGPESSAPTNCVGGGK